MNYTIKGSRSFVSVPCKCSFGGPNDPQGFCASIIGSDIYTQAMGEVSNVLGSSKCHTLDRANYRA
jgi:hypothetical protein